MKKIIKCITSLALVLSLATISSQAVFASQLPNDDFDHTTDGSIIIDYRHDDTPLDDIEFKVYHITTLDEKNEHTLLPKYKDIDLDFDLMYNTKYWMQFRDNLENLINYENIKPEQIFYTDNVGSYHLEDLDLGIYFIQAETAVDNGLEIFSEPILITVGHFDHSDDKWVYHYEIKPKVVVDGSSSYNLVVKKVWENTNSELLIPDEVEVEVRRDGKYFDKVILNEKNNWTYVWHDIEPCDCWAVKELTQFENFETNYKKDILTFTITNTYLGPPDEELPQTGTFAYLIPILASVGLVLVLLGVLLNVKYKN